MIVKEREPKIQDRQTAIVANMMGTITRYGTPLLDERNREKLKGSQTTINYLRKTSSGLGVIKEVGFTILDGTTFMWNRTLPAAIAYGRTHEGNNLLLTGGIFYPGSLRKTGIEPSEADFFPELIAEVPGHFSTFDQAIAFRVIPTSAFTWELTVGGTYPETLSEVPLKLPLNTNGGHILDIISHLHKAAKFNIPRI